MSNRKKSRREIIRGKRRARQQRRQVINRLVWGGIGVVVIGFAGYLIWLAVRPQIGESAPILSSSPHVPPGASLPAYNTNPPTSGQHYAQTFQAGFFDETSQESNTPNPEGFLVHNLEHGYVIFWYNCEILSEEACTALKDQIQSVMEDANNFKVIAFPYNKIEVPVALTSWGRILEMEIFDPELAAQFVDRNRNQAPESNAP